jgi:hypothetical protein
MVIRAILFVFPLSLCVVSALLLGCSGNPTMAGGVETTNGLTVIASGLIVSGSAPAGSMVSLFSDSYNPTQEYGKAFSDSASIDSERTFSFKQIGDSGSYNVFAINPVTRKGAIVPSLRLRSGGHDSIFIPFDTLGEISGVALHVVQSDTVAIGLGDVFLAGSNFFTRTDLAGYYKMGNIPLGKYRVIMPVKASTIVGDKEFLIENVAELSHQNITVISDLIIK